VPGLGVISLLLVFYLTGLFVANIFGQWFVRQWDRLLHKIPIVKSIYSSVKQVSDTLFSSNGSKKPEPADGAKTDAGKGDVAKPGEPATTKPGDASTSSGNSSTSSGESSSPKAAAGCGGGCACH
jgi:hypothetical protein